MKCNPIVIGTSLAPFNIEKQMRAVKSWIENGFYVISCNAKEEIDIVKKAFSSLSIEFVKVERTAEKVTKKLPYIQDILNIVSNKAEEVCGFINSDIILSKMPDGMYEFISDEADKSLVFLRRNEIKEYNDIENLNWTLHFDGIDAFFIDKRMVQNFFNDGFYVQSMWDIYILLKCKVHRVKIKEMVNPIAFHLRHAVVWDFEESNRLIDYFVKMNFGTVKHTYKWAQDLWYRILYKDCEKVCFCNELNHNCLFVVDGVNEDTIRSINEQDYKNKEIVLGKKGEKIKNEYDIIFFVDDGVILSSVFCKAVIYIMEQFKFRRLRIGRFFTSEDNGETYYNELNRNMDVLNKINSECDIYTYAYTIDSEEKEDVKTIYQPISYEMIGVWNNEIVDQIKIDKDFYIIPAGVRGSQWLSEWNAVKDNTSAFLGFIDNNPQKIGNEIMGSKIYSMEKLFENPEATVILASKYYSVEIAQQLADMLLVNRILNASYMLSLDNDMICYFNLEKYKKTKEEKLKMKHIFEK